ncbi:MAG: hypothetical protein P9M13_07855 [Candidatus Ancaeobacter aquaticus]|nr:hypothetical protein [Candidatus Ancaeobacter aquaticus]
MRVCLSFIMLFVVLFTGCVTLTENHFYGVGIKSLQALIDFRIDSYSEGKVKYGSAKSINDDIHAWASADVDPGLTIKITNNTDNPIFTNYFTDGFAITTKDGKVYQLEKVGILEYPSKSYINPGDTFRYQFKNPFGYGSQRLETETAWIVCEIGTVNERVTIILKPLP